MEYNGKTVFFLEPTVHNLNVLLPEFIHLNRFVTKILLLRRVVEGSEENRATACTYLLETIYLLVFVSLLTELVCLTIAI